MLGGRRSDEARDRRAAQDAAIGETWPMHGNGPLRWEAPRTFFGTPSISELDALDAQVAFVGVPYDGGTPEPGVRTGQSLGPTQARLASYYQFEWRWPPGAEDGPGAAGWYDIEADREYLAGVTMADIGDIAIQGSDQEANYERITAVARQLAERGTLMVAVGGDHSISYPLGRGMEPFVESYERSHRGREVVLNKLRYMRGSEPFPGYDALSVEEILAALEEADLETIGRVRGYERKFANRPRVLRAVAGVRRSRLAVEPPRVIPAYQPMSAKSTPSRRGAQKRSGP
jgi:hypothetical protein